VQALAGIDGSTVAALAAHGVGLDISNPLNKLRDLQSTIAQAKLDQEKEKVNMQLLIEQRCCVDACLRACVLDSFVHVHVERGLEQDPPPVAFVMISPMYATRPDSHATPLDPPIVAVQADVEARRKQAEAEAAAFARSQIQAPAKSKGSKQVHPLMAAAPRPGPTLTPVDHSYGTEEARIHAEASTEATQDRLKDLSFDFDFN